MKKVAVIITVYNRKETTLKCLNSLNLLLKSNTWLSGDIFMTDDGSTDGTSDAVLESYPNVHVIQGNGNLYWAGGMNKAWNAACSHGDYDYYIWLNDDAVLYKNAFDLIFEPINYYGDQVIVSGAFKDAKGFPSYGGRDKNKKILTPNGTFQPIFYMNGNLTLIPSAVEKLLGHLDELFIHIGGDWDYGLRAKSMGIKVVLTKDYVGMTNRHDGNEFKGNLRDRIKQLYSKKHNPFRIWRFYMRHFGLRSALSEFIKQHVLFLFPNILKKK